MQGKRMKPKLKVILARPRGFCAGVERAIEIVERAIERHGAPVYVRHEIVHNKRVVGNLKAKGAHFVDELTDIPDGSVTIFSAHGVSENVEKAAKLRNLPVIDATCPLVTKVHKEGQIYAGKGFSVILIGHKGHPEVEGTEGRIPGGVFIVSKPDDVEKLVVPDPTKVSYITQTTLSVDDTRDIIDALKRKFPNIAGPDVKDICYATQNRQSAVRELAKLTDMILVMGSKNSSNSNRLREISQSMGVTAHLIDDANDLDPSWLEGIKTIGLTAGASAPEEVVQELIAKLNELAEVELESWTGIVENVQFKLPPELIEAKR
jgi:4-hydroxy-3-methylbut-2-enyl diphosphate reductase